MNKTYNRSVAFIVSIILVFSMLNRCNINCVHASDEVKEIEFGTEITDTIGGGQTKYYSFAIIKSACLQLVFFSDHYFSVVLYDRSSVPFKTVDSTYSYQEKVHFIQESINLNPENYYLSITNKSEDLGTVVFAAGIEEYVETTYEERYGGSDEKNEIITDGREYKGFLAEKNEFDYYKFEVKTAGRIKLMTDSDNVYYRMYSTDWPDFNENKIYRTYSAYYYKMNQEQDFCLNKGEYYITIAGNSGNENKCASGKYSFSMDFESANESFEEEKTENYYNNVLENAPILKNGYSYKGMFSYAGDKDSYKFSVKDKLSFKIKSDSKEVTAKVLKYDNHTEVVSEKMAWNIGGDCIDRTVEWFINPGVYYLTLEGVNGFYEFELYDSGTPIGESDVSSDADASPSDVSANASSSEASSSNASSNASGTKYEQAHISLYDNGNYLVAGDEAKTEMCKQPVDVIDVNNDGKYTVYDVIVAAFEKYNMGSVEFSHDLSSVKVFNTDKKYLISISSKTNRSINDEITKDDHIFVTFYDKQAESTTTEAPATTEQPATTEAVPSETLAICKAYSNVLRNNYTDNEPAYVIKDLNNDGVPELFVGDVISDSNKFVVDSYYTYKGNKAVKLRNGYGYRGTTRILKNNIVEYQYSVGAYDVVNVYYSLPKGKTKMKKTFELSTRGKNLSNGKTKVLYYKKTGKKKKKISKKQYRKFKNKYGKSIKVECFEINEDSILNMEKGYYSYKGQNSWKCKVGYY